MPCKGLDFALQAAGSLEGVNHSQACILCDRILEPTSLSFGEWEKGFAFLCPSSLPPIWLSSVCFVSGVDSEACKFHIQEVLAPNPEAVLILVPELSWPGRKGGTVEGSKALAPCDLNGDREELGPRPFLRSCPTFDFPPSVSAQLGEFSYQYFINK